MRRKVLGFTLIELMIVVAIIAIIAAIAIPGLLRARISANEGSCSAGLRSLASAQTNFAKSGSVDQDEDGTGEHGIFNELCGIYDLRGTAGASKPKLTITDMSVALKAGAGSYSSKSGYYQQIYLPGSASAITDTTVALTGLDPAATATDAAIQQQENRWICYGWPATYRSSGVRAFVCDQAAEVYASTNTTTANAAIWNGIVSRPTFSDAMMSDGIVVVTATVWNNIAVKAAGIPSHLTIQTWLPSGS